MTRVIFLAAVLAALCYTSQTIPVPAEHNSLEYGFFDKVFNNALDMAKKIENESHIRWSEWRKNLIEMVSEFEKKFQERMQAAVIAFENARRNVGNLLKGGTANAQKIYTELDKERKKIIERFDDELQDGYNKVQSGINNIKKRSEEIMNNMKSTLNKVKTTADGVIENMKERIIKEKPLNFSQVGFTKETTAMSTMITGNAAKTVQNAIDSVLWMFEDAVKRTSGEFANILDKLKLKRERTMEVLNDMMKKSTNDLVVERRSVETVMPSWITEVFKSMNIDQMAKNMLGRISMVTGNMANNVNNATQGVEKIIGDVMGNAESTVKKFMENTRQTIDKMAKELSNRVDNMRNEMGKMVDDNVNIEKIENVSEKEKTNRIVTETKDSGKSVERKTQVTDSTQTETEVDEDIFKFEPENDSAGDMVKEVTRGDEIEEINNKIAEAEDSDKSVEQKKEIEHMYQVREMR